MEYEEKGRRNDDVQFETIHAEKVNFGRNNFLEVARKAGDDLRRHERKFISV